MALHTVFGQFRFHEKEHFEKGFRATFSLPESATTHVRFPVAILELVFGLVLHLLQWHLVEQRDVLVGVDADEHVGDVGVDGILARRKDQRGGSLRQGTGKNRMREGVTTLPSLEAPKKSCLCLAAERGLSMGRTLGNASCMYG